MEQLAGWLATPSVVGVMLLSTRLGALLVMTPLVHAVPVPPMGKLALTLGVSTAIALPLATHVEVPAGIGALVAALLGEAVLGAAMGVGVLVAFAGFSFAGRVLDVQVGFGIGQVLDPVTRAPVPVLTSLFAFLGVLVFLLADGHHGLLRGFALSAERFPPGGAWELPSAGPLLAQASTLFALGFSLAAPVVLCLFLLELALAVIARNLPQANMLLLGIPVKIVAGLAVLALCLPAMAEAMNRLHASIFTGWGALLEPSSSEVRRR